MEIIDEIDYLINEYPSLYKDKFAFQRGLDTLYFRYGTGYGFDKSGKIVRDYKGQFEPNKRSIDEIRKQYASPELETVNRLLAVINQKKPLLTHNFIDFGNIYEYSHIFWCPNNIKIDWKLGRYFAAWAYMFSKPVEDETRYRTYKIGVDPSVNGINQRVYPVMSENAWIRYFDQVYQCSHFEPEGSVDKDAYQRDYDTIFNFLTFNLEDALFALPLFQHYFTIYEEKYNA